MKKGLKIGGVVVGIVVLVFLALLAAVKLVVTPERVRKTVIPLAERSLHRQIQLSDIQIRIFSGIVLKNLLIAEKDGGAVPFVRADQVKLRYQFWPLLQKRVVVDEISLDAPQISVVRLPDGTFNFSDMTKKKEGEPPARTEEVHLLVSKVEIARGVVRYEDRKKEKPFVYTVGDIGFSATDIALDKPFSFKGRGAIPGLVAELEGKAAAVGKQPAIDAVLKVPGADLRKLVAGLAPEVVEKIRKMDPAGTVSARVHLAGETAKPKELLKDGEVRLEKIQVTTSGQRPTLDGTLSIQGDAVSSRNLSLALGENRLAIAFNAANILAKPVTVSSTVSADKFDLDPFLGGAKGATGGAAPEAAKPEPGPLNLPVHATGTVQIGRTSYKGLPVTGLLMRYRLANNVLTVDELRGTVSGGSFTDSAQVDLNRKGFSYATKLRLQAVQAAPVIAAFAPKAAGTVSGTLSLNADIKGAGTQGDAMKRNLSGEGSFEIANGKITGAPLVENLAAFVNLGQLRVLQFSKYGGTFRMVNGKVVLDSDVSGTDFRLTPKGTIGLDKSLDLSFITRLSPALSGKITGGELGRFTTDEKGWGVLPLKVGGTVTSPRFRLDTAALREQATGKAKETIKKTIEEKFLKKKEGQPVSPGQDVLEKGLKGIFGQ